MIMRKLLAIGIIALALAAAGLACNFGSQPTPSPVPADTVEPTGDTGESPQLSTPVAAEIHQEASNAVQAAIYALAVYLDRDPATFALISVIEADFPDAALGCPRPGEMPAAAITPGYTVILGDSTRQYEIHTSLDGLRVRCLNEQMQSDEGPSSSGIMATIRALEQREYGTLASLLPSSVIISAYPEAEQSLTANAFVALLRDIWLGPADLQIDLNTNVLALMPTLELPPNQIPVYSTGWGVNRDADAILFFDLSGQTPILGRVLFVPAGQQDSAYSTSPDRPGEGDASLLPTYQADHYSIGYPQGWYSSTVGSQASFQPPDTSVVAVTVGSWSPPRAWKPHEGESFRSWVEALLAKTTNNYESINTMHAIWATTGQPGYLATWNARRADGVLEIVDPVALFESHHTVDGTEFYALAVSLLDAAYRSEFQEMTASLTIQQAAGVPADMDIYRHDELGYRIQFPAGWKLLASPIGAAFQPPEEAVAITVGPWPMMNGPAAGQAFEEWVANAPADGIQGFGSVHEITQVEASGGDTGYLVTWQTSLPGSSTGVSDPVAVFPFRRQTSEGQPNYHALAISLLVPTYTQTFERMIATLVIEKVDDAAMVYVPAGPFARGSDNGQVAAWAGSCGNACRADEFTDETPQRIITLPGYYVDRTEVTVAQFKAFAEATGYQTTSEKKGDAVEYTWRAFDSPDRQDHPVRWMSWDDANAYCQWAGQRLPTEAEWEKAARGEDGRTWPWGSEWHDDRAPRGDTVPADAYVAGASPYGALGMAGNVWEWVADWYDPYYYGSSPAADPPGPPPSGDKVLRGGGFSNDPWALRTAHRHYGGAQGYANDHGFRCAADG